MKKDFIALFVDVDCGKNSNILREQVSIVSKQLSTVVFSASALAGFGYLCNEIREDWKARPTYNTMEMKCIVDSEILPAVSLCNCNAFRKSKVAELNLTNYAKNIELYNSLNTLKSEKICCDN